MALIVLAHNMLATAEVSVPSLFVPEQYVSNTFEVSIAGNVYNLTMLSGGQQLKQT